MIINSIQRIIFAISILTMSSSVISKEISYDFIQGGLINTPAGNDNDPTPGGDGFEFSGSFSVMPNIAITAGYERMEFDENLVIDVETFDLGVTAHTSRLGPGSSAFVNLSALYGEAKENGGATSSDSDTGYLASVGIRSMVTDIFELNLDLSREDLFDDHDVSFEFAGRIYPSEKVSFGAGVVFSRNAEKSLVVNARVNF